MLAMLLCFFMLPPAPRSTLFPYTTLFRSAAGRALQEVDAAEQGGLAGTAGPDDGDAFAARHFKDRKSTRLNSSHVEISYAVFCLKKKTRRHPSRTETHPCRSGCAARLRPRTDRPPTGCESRLCPADELHVGDALVFFHAPASTEIYTLSLHDALPICRRSGAPGS